MCACMCVYIVLNLSSHCNKKLVMFVFCCCYWCCSYLAGLGLGSMTNLWKLAWLGFYWPAAGNSFPALPSPHSALWWCNTRRQIVKWIQLNKLSESFFNWNSQASNADKDFSGKCRVGTGGFSLSAVASFVLTCEISRSLVLLLLFVACLIVCLWLTCNR